MDNKKFYSKVLLFGEYGVLSNSNALSIPFEKFYGYLNKSDFLNNEEKISNSNILQLYEFMTDLDIKDKIDFNFFSLIIFITFLSFDIKSNKFLFSEKHFFE